ncbi:hypothetical protein IC607_08600 [Cellulomonas sp. JH27-2]|uniref:hypothetical protein n=1 Tax=Cellulomonas sp. JH27-2 TaxID=2774139 RepID=UPI0017801326|nr:hypothetical protein [Cellulomonas sp. JH27-2]MBD8059026.1 hypothetical protein [Cellulomonas sp. JH27-2]
MSIALNVARGGAAVTLGLAVVVPVSLPWAGISTATVGGRSMTPTYAVGDIVWTAVREVHVGDVVRIRQGNESFVHRVTAIDDASGRIHTKGDGNPHPDPGTTAPADVHGVVVAHAGGLRADAWRYGTTWPARSAMALLAVLLWPTSTKRRSRQLAVAPVPSRVDDQPAPGHTGPVRPEGAGEVVVPGVRRRRDLRSA